MKLKYFNQFILEQVQEEKEDVASGAQYDDMKSELREMVEKSLKTSDNKTFDDFVSAYVRNPEETQIEGLINDSDIYDFYLKYRNDIDEMLSEINFYDDVPSEMSSFSLYDYVIKGTKKAISEIMNQIKEEGSKSEETTSE